MSPNGDLVYFEKSDRAALELFLEKFDAARGELRGYFVPRGASTGEGIGYLHAASAGAAVPNGWVPSSTWFWEDHGAFRGVLNLRHRLTPTLEQLGGHVGFAVAPSARRQGVAKAMLAAALPHARRYDIDPLLLTCAAANRASARTIEANGGRLLREGWCEDAQTEQRWYRISLPVNPNQAS